MTTLRPTSVVAATVALTLAAAAPATASTVSAVGGLLNYTAGPSEANVLDIDIDGGGAATITDAPGVSITAGAGCTNPEGDNTASCTGATIQYFIEAGDLNDSVDMSGVVGPLGTSEIRGGSGDDGLLASPFDEDVKGDQGDDVLAGGFGSDLFFGGDGRDVVRYTEVTRGSAVPVTASLDGLTNDGAPGENDNVNQDGTVEDLTGGGRATPSPATDRPTG